MQPHGSALTKFPTTSYLNPITPDIQICWVITPSRMYNHELTGFYLGSEKHEKGRVDPNVQFFFHAAYIVLCRINHIGRSIHLFTYQSPGSSASVPDQGILMQYCRSELNSSSVYIRYCS